MTTDDSRNELAKYSDLEQTLYNWSERHWVDSQESMDRMTVIERLDHIYDRIHARAERAEADLKRTVEDCKNLQETCRHETARAEKAEIACVQWSRLATESDLDWKAHLQQELDSAKAAYAEMKTELTVAKLNAGQVPTLLVRLNNAEAACAEMRAVLVNAQNCFECEACQRRIHHALSTDCGKDWVKRAELDAANDKLATARNEWSRMRVNHESLAIELAAIKESRNGLALSLIKTGAKLESSKDDPECDGTDNAHPAYWRGHKAGSLGAADAFERIIDRGDNGGVMGHPIMERVKQKILAMEAELFAAKAERSLTQIPQEPESPILDIAQLRPLIAEVVNWHSDPGSGDYNHCDENPCMWCSRARQALGKDGA